MMRVGGGWLAPTCHSLLYPESVSSCPPPSLLPRSVDGCQCRACCRPRRLPKYNPKSPKLQPRCASIAPTPSKLDMMCERRAAGSGPHFICHLLDDGRQGRAGSTLSSSSGATSGIAVFWRSRDTIITSRSPSKGK